jgi:hypothetical protein
MMKKDLILMSIFIEGLVASPEDIVQPATKDEALAEKERTDNLNKEFDSMSTQQFLEALKADFYDVMEDQKNIRSACAGIGVMVRLFIERKINTEKK